MTVRQAIAVVVLAAVSAYSVVPLSRPAGAQDDKVASLLRAYPDFLDRIEGNDLVWKDGTRMPIADGRPPKTLDAMLDQPDLKDMFAMIYPAGEKGLPPPTDFDPGRVRYAPLFKRMYGDCAAGEVMKNTVDVVWLPSRYGKKLKFTRINNAAGALQQVASELDRLSASLLDYLAPPAGTYNCRPIAGTGRTSPHGFGIAIDIATAKSDYWLWKSETRYRNRIPWEIVNVFERHGFIWGGKWYHYDTMHFEYRPEMIATAK
jgi:hypothetical protein